MKIKTNIKHRRSKRIMRIIIPLSMILGVMVWAAISINEPYSNPPLTGKWISLETGKTVEFTEEGFVNVDQIQTGDYSIKEPNTMIYDVDGYSFEMYYDIKERNLTWGLIGEEEYFERKGL